MAIQLVPNMHVFPIFIHKYAFFSAKSQPQHYIMSIQHLFTHRGDYFLQKTIHHNQKNACIPICRRYMRIGGTELSVA